jgi:hypothetical protein
MILPSSGELPKENWVFIDISEMTLQMDCDILDRMRYLLRK